MVRVCARVCVRVFCEDGKRRKKGKNDSPQKEEAIFVACAPARMATNGRTKKKKKKKKKSERDDDDDHHHHPFEEIEEDKNDDDGQKRRRCRCKCARVFLSLLCLSVRPTRRKRPPARRRK